MTKLTPLRLAMLRLVDDGRVCRWWGTGAMTRSWSIRPPLPSTYVQCGRAVGWLVQQKLCCIPPGATYGPLELTAAGRLHLDQSGDQP